MYAVVKQKMADGYEIDSISWLPSTDNGSVFTQYYESWQTPVIARRHFVKQGSQTEDIQYLLGWRATIDDQEHVSVLIIDPKANSIEICNSL